MGYPTIFPTGTLKYDNKKAWSGYTLFPSARGALLIDMNGNDVYPLQAFLLSYFKDGQDLMDSQTSYCLEDMYLEIQVEEKANMHTRISWI